MLKDRIIKRKLLIAFCLATVFILLLAYLFYPKNKVVAYINEEKVTSTEFNFYLDNIKSHVYQAYAKKYGLSSYEQRFWQKEYKAGSSFVDYARDLALKNCLRFYALQKLAYANQISDVLSFAELKKMAHDFNEQRKKVKELGEHIYGPSEFSFDEYYHHYISRLKIALKQKWQADNIVSEEDISNFYMHNSQLFSINGERKIALLYLRKPRANLQAIFSLLEQNSSIALAQKNDPDLIDYKVLDFNIANEKDLLLQYPHILAEGSKMSVGEIRQVKQRSEQSFLAIKLISANAPTVLPLEEVHNRIVDLLLNEYLDKAISQTEAKLAVIKTEEFNKTMIS